MSELPPCPKCESPYTYEDGELLICPECAHEWSLTAAHADAPVVRDSNGTPLADGDTVSVIKDLKVKGAGQTLKQGTLIKSIRLTGDDQEIDCKYPGIKGLVLRAEFVKKR